MRIATMDFDFSPRQVIVLLLAGYASVAGAVPASAEPIPAERVASWRTVVVREPALPAPGTAWTPRVRAEPARTGGPDLVTGGLGRTPAAASPRRIEPGHALDGVASFYWQGQKTASGEAFDRSAMTAAHPTLPFNSRVRVTHLQTGRSVEVRINDRGPFKPGRVIDLSQRAAEELGITARGLARVRLEVVSN